MSPAPLALESWGTGLHRPECVLTTPAGSVFVPDWRGGVTAIRADGSQQTWLARDTSMALRPNGIAFARDGTLLVANLGSDGGVWRLGWDRRIAPFLVEVEGVRLPPANFVTVDESDRTWISVSTRQEPRQRAWRPAAGDGFVVVVDARGARVVADELQYTNEVRPDPSGRWLYVVETYGRRVVRFPITPDASLGRPETVVELDRGFPDGFAFDETGGIWVTSLVDNRVLRVGADGRVEVVIEEVNEPFVEAAARAFAGGTMTAHHLGPIPDTRLQQVTSIAFGGPDRRTAYLGSLHGTCLYRFRAPVAGAPPSHWGFALGGDAR
jgi:sugar lactone lactonase YvrE